MSLSKIRMTHAFQSAHDQHGMRLCACYRARITAIFANSTSHPILSPPSSARPHNHAPHGVSRHRGESGPVVALHARARTLSRTRTRTRDSHARLAQHGTHLRPLGDHCMCEPARFPARTLSSAGPFDPSPRTHTSTCTRTRAHRGTHMSTHARDDG